MNKFFKRVMAMRERVPKEDDRAYVRRLMSNEAELSKIFLYFMLEAVNRGGEACITIEVDGQKCISGVFVPVKDPMMEYIANWAATQRTKKTMALDEFDRIMDRIQAKQVDGIMKDMGAG